MFFCKTSTIFPPRREIYMDKNGFENEDFTSKRFIQIHIYSRSSSRISISSFEIFLTYHPLLVKKNNTHISFLFNNAVTRKLFTGKGVANMPI